MADFCTFLHSLFRLFSSSVIREGSHQPMSEAGRKLGDCGVLRVAACVRWPRRGPAVCMQCKSGHAALAINIATTSLQMHKRKHKASRAPGSGRIDINGSSEGHGGDASGSVGAEGSGSAGTPSAASEVSGSMSFVSSSGGSNLSSVSGKKNKKSKVKLKLKL